MWWTPQGRCETAAAVTQEHVEKLLILQHDGSFHQILKVGVDAGADTGVLGHPLLRLHVDVVPHLQRERGEVERKREGEGTSAETRRGRMETQEEVGLYYTLLILFSPVLFFVTLLFFAGLPYTVGG